MKYNDLMNRVIKANALIQKGVSLKNKKIKVSYLGNTLTNEKSVAEYDIVISDELQHLLDITGETEYHASGYTFCDSDDTKVIARPNYSLKMGDYIGWMAYNYFYLIYDDKIIYRETHCTKTCTYGISPITNPVGIYREHLIAERDEEFVMIDTKGNIVVMTYNWEPEDGRDDHKYARINGHQFESGVYCYCDNDWRHGDWERNSLNIDELIEDKPKTVLFNIIKTIISEYGASMVWVNGNRGYFTLYSSGVRDKNRVGFTINVQEKIRTRCSSETNYYRCNYEIYKKEDGTYEIENLESEIEFDFYEFLTLKKEEAIEMINKLALERLWAN